LLILLLLLSINIKAPKSLGYIYMYFRNIHFNIKKMVFIIEFFFFEINI